MISNEIILSAIPYMLHEYYNGFHSEYFWQVLFEFRENYAIEEEAGSSIENSSFKSPIGCLTY